MRIPNRKIRHEQRVRRILLTVTVAAMLWLGKNSVLAKSVLKLSSVNRGGLSYRCCNVTMLLCGREDQRAGLGLAGVVQGLTKYCMISCRKRWKPHREQGGYVVSPSTLYDGVQRAGFRDATVI